jgi:hypothetical protein
LRKYFFDDALFAHSNLYDEHRTTTRAGNEMRSRLFSSLCLSLLSRGEFSHSFPAPFRFRAIEIRKREVTRDNPLRLADAINIAFPHAGMTLPGLRREGDRKRLIVERITGKEFIALALSCGRGNPLPHRLLAHLRRWHRTAPTAEHFITYDGQAIASVKRHSRTPFSLPGLGRESRRTHFGTPRRRG